jgi:FHA domain-containing protein
MATCPSGHDSASDDFCDVCGIRIGAVAEFPPSPAVTLPDGGATATMPAPAGACPQCGAARTGQFCESCGHDFTTATSASAGSPSGLPPAAPPPAAVPPVPAAAPPVPAAAPPAPAARPPVTATWTAVVTADRLYFDQVVAAVGADASELSFPAYCPERRFRLSGTEVRVGRRSVSRGIHPEIDLTGPPADPGVSRLHAVLVAGPDGTWSVVDPGSENGTLVNGTTIPANQAVALHDGDRIHLGAWTALTITRDPEVMGG